MENKPVTLEFHCDHDCTSMQVTFQEGGDVVFLINDVDGNDHAKQVILNDWDVERLRLALSELVVR